MSVLKCYQLNYIIFNINLNKMAEFDLDDLEKINNSREIIDFLVDKGIIKEKKFRKQLKYERELNQLQYEM